MIWKQTQKIRLLDNLMQYSDEDLIVDGRVPCVLNATVEDELRLYNLDRKQQKVVIDEFEELMKKPIQDTDYISSFSGGQRCVLALLGSLASPATNIRLCQILRQLDTEKTRILFKNGYNSPTKNITII